MTRWIGQFKREWIVMKSSVLIYAMLNLIVVVGGSLFLAKIVGGSPDWYDNVLIIGGFWFVIGMLVGGGVLLKSLEGDMKSPHIWLHAPSSMIELLSVKVVFATCITALLLVWSELIIVLSFFISDATLPVSYVEAFLILLLVFIALVLDSIYVTAVALFFWSIYRVFRTRTRTFGFVIAFALFWGLAYLWERIRVFGFFEALEKIVPLNLIDSALYGEPSKYFFITVVADGVIVSVGTFIFYMLLSVFLIWAGAELFEKKARL